MNSFAKTKRLWIAIVATVIALFCAVCFVACGGDTSEESNGDTSLFTYKSINNDTEYEISGIKDKTKTSLTIPSTYNGKPVTRIGVIAFEECSNLTSVEIPDSITRICDGAFRKCVSLNNVKIGPNVEAIEGWAFAGCSSLDNITLPDKVIKIGGYETHETSFVPGGINTVLVGGYTIFCDTKYYLDKNNWKQNVLYIGNHLITARYESYLNNNFSSLSGSYSVKEGTKTIAAEAFSGCKITDVYLPSSVEYIGVEAFDGSDLTHIYMSEGLKTIEEKAFNDCKSLESITIPDSVESIGINCFQRCEKLTELNIGAGISSLKYSFLYGCNKLKYLRIPETVKSIDSHFSYGTKLESVLFCGEICNVNRNAFIDCTTLKKVYLSIKYNLFMPWHASGIRYANDPLVLADKYFYYEEYPSEIIWNVTEGKCWRFVSDIPTEWIRQEDCSHTFTSWKSIDACYTSESYSVRYCTKCGYLDEKGVAGVTHPHTFEYVSPKSATCENEGVSTWYRCKVCGKDAIKITTPALGHNYGGYIDVGNKHLQICKRTSCKKEKVDDHNYSWTVVKEANCTETGIRNGKCKDCAHETTEDMPIAHRWDSGKVTKEPDCTNPGNRLMTCLSCGITENVTIPAKGHAYDDGTVIINPTCTDKGKKKFVCSVCGDVKNEDIDANGHTPNAGTITKEPTCTEAGKSTHKCIVCGETFEREIAALGHDYESHIYKAPTCTEAGSEAYASCIWCGYSTEHKIPALGHSMRYTNNGDYHNGECERCDYSVTEEPHTTINWTINKHATCITTGTRSGACDLCGARFTEEIPLLSHEFYYELRTEQKDTGAEKVYTHFVEEKCRNCNHSRVVNEGGTIHIHYGVELIDDVAPTCTESGFSTGLRCAVEGCGEILVEQQETTPALGHNFINDKCTRCGMYYNDPNATEGLGYTEIKVNGKVAAYEVWGIGTAKETDIVVASTYNGLYVISIRDQAFYSRNITSVKIPSSITSIGRLAFGSCDSLTSIIVDIGNTKYHSSGNCIIETATKTLVAGCGNSTIPTDGSITSIGYEAFAYCHTLTSIEIPNSVTSIGSDAFRGCSSLTSIEIPNSVTSIGSSAFSGCSSLNSIDIPNSVTSIGGYAFSGCSSLTSIEIPNSVTYIGSDAFRGCRNLTSMEIPFSVTSIGGGIFGSCDSLTNVIVDPSNSKYHSSGNCIIETATKTLIVGCGNSAIPTDGSVTSIGDNAFAYCESLTSIEMPSSVTSIRSDAFLYCSSLTNIEIPNSVTSIGSSAFSFCRSLTAIIIPSSVTTIDYRAFEYCDALTIYCVATSKPSGWYYTSSDDYFNWNPSGCPVVWNCRNNVKDNNGYEYAIVGGLRYRLKNTVASVANQSISISGNIDIPESIVYNNVTYKVTTILDYAFEGCANITSVTLPTTITNIGCGAFYSCTNIEVVYWNAKSCTVTTTTADSGCFMVFGSSEKLTRVVIANVVTSIPGYAFANCAHLQDIEIPSSVTSIGSNAFSDCSSLSSITIPSSVKSMGSGVFYNCSMRMVINCEATSKPSGWSSTWYNGSGYNSNYIVWDSKNNNKYIEIKGIRYALNDNVATVEILPATISGNIVIPSYIEYNNKQYTVTGIGYGAFIECNELTSIELPNSLTSIGSHAFSGCSSLTSIEILASVSRIGSHAFYGCGIKSVYISNLEAWCKIAFDDYDANPLHCAQNLYINNELVNELAIPNTIKRIGSYAFYGYDSLMSIEIPNTVTSISSYAFYGCNSLTSIEIPNSVTYIGDSAFYGCIGLTSIEIPSSVTSIGDNAFSGCSSLTSMTVASGNTKYHSSGNCIIVTATKMLLAGCRTSIIPADSSVTSIGSYAFSGCSSLISIDIPNSVTSIGSYAFSGCSGLISIDIPSSVTSIGSYAFSGCSGLISIDIPNSVTSIGYYAFYDCSNLIRIIIPESVVSISKNAFLGCESLKMVKFANVNGWSYSSSSNTTSGTSISSADLSNISTAAIFLTSKSKYLDYYWKRNG